MTSLLNNFVLENIMQSCTDKITYLEFVKKKSPLPLNESAADLEPHAPNVKYYFRIKYIPFLR